MDFTMAYKDIDPPIFPTKGQMMALQAPPGFHLRHTIYAYGVGGIVPKSDGTIYVGSTVEQVGFDKGVTAGGIAFLLAAVAKLTPDLNSARFVRTWAGLRPASADGLPLISLLIFNKSCWLLCSDVVNANLYLSP
jgi:glycine oxidase